MTTANTRAAMGTALRTISGLHASDYFTGEVVPPHSMFDYSVDPNLTFADGAHRYVYRIETYLSVSSIAASQKFADSLRDPTSASGLRRTIQENATLAAACHYAKVMSIGELQPVTFAGVEYLMFPTEVEVVA